MLLCLGWCLANSLTSLERQSLRSAEKKRENMLEPDEDQVEANLHVAVELGQRLLKRNQALLEEQVGLRRALAEKELHIKVLQI